MAQAGGDWHVYLDEAMLTYNTCASPNLDGLSPFELVFGRKAKILPDLELTPTAPIAVTYQKYLKKSKNS